VILGGLSDWFYERKSLVTFRSPALLLLSRIRRRRAFRIFAETVMSAKEEAERQRETAALEMGPFDGDDVGDESDPGG